MTKAKTQARAAAAPTAPAKPQTALTIATGQIGPYGYGAGLLINDVPPDVISANPEWLSADPEAVKKAQAAGVDAVPFRG